MTITPQNGDLTAGVANHYAENVLPEGEALITGDVPAVFATEEIVTSGENLEAYAVVGFTAGKLVPATNAIKAVGVLVYAVDASGGDAVGHVYRGGVFNPDVLVWDATLNTDALKKAAFEGSPSPTQITLRKIQTLAV